MQNLHECTINGDWEFRNADKKKVKYFTILKLVENNVKICIIIR